jgi:hypothetical protein
MEFEIDDCDALFDHSTNPSLARPRSVRSRHARLASWNRKPCRKAVTIPEEEEQLV